MRWVRLLLAVALLGGCSGGRDDDTLPPPASTTTAVDYSVPEVIDVAYVEKVMAALDHVYGDAIRTLARERTITKEFLDHLAAIYGDRFFRLAQQAWAQETSEGLSSLAERPGDPATRVQRLISSQPTCLVAAVERDFAPIRKGPPVSTPQRYVALIPRSTNDTGWVLSYDGFTESGMEPNEPCGG